MTTTTTGLLDFLSNSSVNLSALPPPGLGLNYEEEQEEFRIPRGTWIWLLLLVPICVGICVVRLYMRFKDEELVDELPAGAKMEDVDDKYGHFHVVKPTFLEKPPRKPVVFIDVGELPQTRPLGIELQELKVIRVFSAGKQWGWQVGDVVVSVAGQAVLNFEELWDRIQAERDRVPVRFCVERQGAESVDIDQEELERAKQLAKQMRAPGPKPQDLEGGMAPEEIAKLRMPTQAWLPSGANSPSSVALPSTVPGFETWVAPIEGDEAPQQEKRRHEPGGPPRAELKTTAFMRTYPLTPGEKLKRSLQRPQDVGHRDVRFIKDAWGRSVIKVGN